MNNTNTTMSTPEPRYPSDSGPNSYQLYLEAKYLKERFPADDEQKENKEEKPAATTAQQPKR